jgi:sterol 3beta-glucosyltransferase
MRLDDNALRRHQLGLPPRPVWRSTRRRETEVPLVYAYGPAVLGLPPDWPANVHVTGYWFLDLVPGWQPPPALVDFLEAGPPPMSIGFGSMIGQDGRHAIETIVNANTVDGVPNDAYRVTSRSASAVEPRWPRAHQ